jgi:hypothetical protein
VRIGVRKPQRLLVRFVGDEFEGRQDWVPPSRLKVPWRDLDAFIARELRWEGVAGESPAVGSPEESAAGVVFDLLIDPGLATLGYNATCGVTRVHEVDGLAASLGLESTALRSDPLAFEEDGDLVVPWPVTSAIVARAAERDPNRILDFVEREEADARREAVFGRDYPGRGRAEARHVPPEVCAQVDREHEQPVRAFLRVWCGQGPVDLRREIAELRGEVSRLAALAQSALEALRRNGHVREANRLESELGPVRRPGRGGPQGSTSDD